MTESGNANQDIGPHRPGSGGNPGDAQPAPPGAQPPYGEAPSAQQPYGQQQPYSPPSYGQQQPYAQQEPYGQEPFGQPPYVQPQPYSQQPYSQQPYSQQPYSQQPYSQQPHVQPQPYGEQPPFGLPAPGAFQPYAPGYAAGPPARKSRLRRLWPLLAGAVGVALVLGIVGAVFGSDENPGSSHTLSAPAQSGAYTKQTGALADQVSNSATTTLQGKFNEKDLRIGVYSLNGSATPQFVFLGVQSGNLADKSRDATIKSFMKGAKVSNATTVDPGPLGGKMACGSSSDGEETCAWVDHNTLGALVFVTLTGSTAEDVARTFRSDAEK